MNAKAIALIAAALVSGAGLSFAQDGRWDRVTLTNGRVLQGSVSRDGDHYLLRLPLGSIRVPASQVDTIEAQHDPMDEMEHMQQAGFPNGTLGQRQRYATHHLSHLRASITTHSRHQAPVSSRPQH